jgi:hypothetical protein
MPKSPSRKAGCLEHAIAAESWGKTPSSPTAKAKARAGRIMYIECKAGSLIGNGRIGRVTFSKTGSTIYYRGQTFQSSRARDSKRIIFAWRRGKITGFPGRNAEVAILCIAAMSPSRSMLTCVRNIGRTFGSSRSEFTKRPLRIEILTD